MSDGNCRVNSGGAKRIRYVPAGDGRVRLAAKEGIRAFIAKTGRDPRQDLFLLVYMKLLIQGLDEEYAASAEKRPRRNFVLDRDAASQLRSVELPLRRGRPSLAPELSRAIYALVRELGPACTALLLLIMRQEGHPAFVVARAQPTAEQWDVRVLLRRLEQRLSVISRDHQRAASLQLGTLRDRPARMP